MRFVVDASVLFKILVSEADTDLAIRLLQAGVGAPDLIFSEVANALWKAHRRGGIALNDLRRAASVLTRVDLDVIEGRLLTGAALKHAAALDHAAYDCIYLALAEREGVPVVTADARFQRKVAAAGLSVEVLLLPEAASRL